jgi:uncharacterized protein
MNPPARIIDFHCHIASTDYFPRSFIDGVVDNMAVALEAKGVRPNRQKIFDLYAAKFQDPLCDQLVREMDEAGIGKAVLLLPDFTYALSDATLTIAEMIDRHKAVRDRHAGRLLVFAGVDPRWGADGVRLFEKSVAGYGFDGLKVYPPCGFTPSDRRLYPYYEICAQHGIPVLLHVGASSPALSFESCRPLELDQAARDFPAVNFILAHGSVHYPDECAMMCSNRPNVYLDVSGFETSDLADLKAVFSRNITHKILFGTDWPLFRLQAPQSEWVGRLAQGADVFPAGMRPQQREDFFYRNAERILSRKVRSERGAESVAAAAAR